MDANLLPGRGVSRDDFYDHSPSKRLFEKSTDCCVGLSAFRRSTHPKFQPVSEHARDGVPGCTGHDLDRNEHVVPILGHRDGHDLDIPSPMVRDLSRW